MKKIDPKELGLLVKSQEYYPFETQWVTEVIRVLIRQRIQHCRAQLDAAMAKDEVFFTNHLDSQIIIYVDKDGNNYGHFGVPTYNNMIAYLENEIIENRGIAQQALRQYFENIHLENANYYEVLDTLKSVFKTETDLEGALTEMILVLQ